MKGFLKTIITKSAKETELAGQKLGAALNKRLCPLICFFGPLGSGKTTFIRGLAKGLGIKSRIQSPTFNFERIYFGKPSLRHFDCYRIEKPDILSISQINEAVYDGENSVVAVEWAENLKKFLPQKRIEVHIKYINEQRRKITIRFYE